MMAFLLLRAPAIILVISSSSSRAWAPCCHHSEKRRLQGSKLTHGEIERYSRHLILEDVGIRGQEKLKEAKVLCVGAGGLGSPAMMYLAAAGIGRITVIDDDVVDFSNLQRQIVHDTALVGTLKTESAEKSVRRINPNVEFIGLVERLTDLERAMEIIREHDVVVDGSDNFPTKFLIDDACTEAGVPLVYAAILRFEGQASVFNYPPGIGPTYRDYMAKPPPAGTVPSCAEGGVLGVLCGVLGAIQATEAIKILLGRPPSDTLANRLLCYNALKMTFRDVPLAKKRRSPLLEEEDESPSVEEDNVEINVIDAVSVAERLAEGWNPFVLDVRLPQEAEIASLPFVDALLPHRQVNHDTVTEIPRDRDILVHCKSGFRSNLACRELYNLGYTRLYNLQGGILAWATHVDPRMPRY